MNDEKRQHLEFVQNIITRMNSNSFQIKGMAVTIVSALLAVYASNSKIEFILVAIFPTVVFWLLDSYYLNQERIFRGIYNDVAGLTDKKEAIIVQLYEMPLQKYVGGKYNQFNAFISPTILFLYLPVIVFLSILWYRLK
jgi:lipopolysaccharide export LptBFGC system permease protein LptF